MKSELVIRNLQPEDSIPQITKLLHASYAPLKRMGLHYLASHQGDEITRERLERGYPIIAECEGVIIGTVTLYPTNLKSQCSWYWQEGVYSFGQFAVHPDFQRGGV